MKLGVHSKVFSAHPFAEAMSKVRASGLEAIQLNFSAAGLPALPDEIPERTIAEIRAVSQESGVDIAVVSGTFNTLEQNPETLRDNLRRFEAVVAAANRLGVPFVAISTGSFNQSDYWSPHPDNHTPAAWDCLFRSLDSMVAAAEKHGVTIVFEPEQANVVSTAEDALRLMDRYQTPRLRVLFDAANFITTADAGNPMLKIARSLEALRDYIAMAHCKDCAVTNENITFLPVGRGNLPLREYLDELGRFYDGAVILHGLDESEIPFATEYLVGNSGNGEVKTK